MNSESLFPTYIPRRQEEELIRRAVADLREHRTTSAVLLYGDGGVGKTWLVRALVKAGADGPDPVWVGPVDIDDSEYWLLSNLERYIADRLDPGNEEGHFSEYLDQLARLYRFTRPTVSHETAISYLARIKDVFVECYSRYIKQTGKTVVIIFDTVEAIRGMDLLVTVTQLMKALPATLFIVSGRPPHPGNHPDPIYHQLSDPNQGIPTRTVVLKDFSLDSAMEYLTRSGIAAGLSEPEKLTLVRLTRGHPLWLAFTVSYLDETGLPEEASTPLEYLNQEIPYEGGVSNAGQKLQEEYNRRLLISYREADFWHDAIKRLAVARQSVSISIWRQLMNDRPPPEGCADLDAAWPILRRTPWIRTRGANGQYVTLHDVVAEELARRIIPVHDQSKQWRHELWTRAAQIYRERVVARDEEISDQMKALYRRQEEWEARLSTVGEDGQSASDERGFVDLVAELDVQRRELSQFKVVRFYYEALSDFSTGCELFLTLLAEAKVLKDVLFQELLIAEMQRFLPGGSSHTPGDVVGERIDEFRLWLEHEGRERYFEIGVNVADSLVMSGKPQAALDLVDRIPPRSTDHDEDFRLSILRGNAYIRLPGAAQEAKTHFEKALAAAEARQTPDRLNFIANAYKELGFYFRNMGQWREADTSYQHARDAMSERLAKSSTADDREEMASIQTNWAYVKGLSGSFKEGTSLVESAIGVRHRLNLQLEEGTSWSVCGEIYRYEHLFVKAWQAYAEAERIFQQIRNWPWLGLLYQEQGICLYQAAQEGIQLVPDRDAGEEARRLLRLSIDLCRNLAIRNYPSALYRAGRVFGQDDVEAGLEYFDRSIEWANQLADGRSRFASLVEYVELCYREWVKSHNGRYLDLITARELEIEQAVAQYGFPDLGGRWRVVQGHRALHNWVVTRQSELLDTALECYKDGFEQLARPHVGSSGASAMVREFRRLATLMRELPAEVKEAWQEEFRRAWHRAIGATLLLARLEELY